MMYIYLAAYGMTMARAVAAGEPAPAPAVGLEHMDAGRGGDIGPLDAIQYGFKHKHSDVTQDQHDMDTNDDKDRNQSDEYPHGHNQERTDMATHDQYQNQLNGTRASYMEKHAAADGDADQSRRSAANREEEDIDMDRDDTGCNVNHGEHMQLDLEKPDAQSDSDPEPLDASRHSFKHKRADATHDQHDTKDGRDQSQFNETPYDQHQEQTDVAEHDPYLNQIGRTRGSYEEKPATTDESHGHLDTMNMARLGLRVLDQEVLHRRFRRLQARRQDYEIWLWAGGIAEENNTDWELFCRYAELHPPLSPDERHIAPLRRRDYTVHSLAEDIVRYLDGIWENGNMVVAEHIATQLYRYGTLSPKEHPMGKVFRWVAMQVMPYVDTGLPDEELTPATEEYLAWAMGEMLRIGGKHVKAVRAHKARTMAATSRPLNHAPVEPRGAPTSPCMQEPETAPDLAPTDAPAIERNSTFPPEQPCVQGPSWTPPESNHATDSGLRQMHPGNDTTEKHTNETPEDEQDTHVLMANSHRRDRHRSRSPRRPPARDTHRGAPSAATSSTGTEPVPPWRRPADEPTPPERLPPWRRGGNPPHRHAYAVECERQSRRLETHDVTAAAREPAGEWRINAPWRRAREAAQPAPTAKPRVPIFLPAASSARAPAESSPETVVYVEEIMEEELPESDPNVDPTESDRRVAQDLLARMREVEMELGEEEDPPVFDEERTPTDTAPAETLATPTFEEEPEEEPEEEDEEVGLMQTSKRKHGPVEAEEPAPKRQRGGEQVTQEQAAQAISRELDRMLQESKAFWDSRRPRTAIPPGELPHSVTSTPATHMDGATRRRRAEQDTGRRRRSCATGTWEEELDLLHVDTRLSQRDNTAQAESAEWTARQPQAQPSMGAPAPSSMATAPADTQPDTPTQPLARQQSATAIVCDSSDEEVVRAVEEWERENGPMAAQTVVRVAGEFDVVHLMQAVDPTHALLQHLQDTLDRLPLLRQATRCRMLQHRLREWAGVSSPSSEATSLQALLTVYQQEVPVHKMYPTDEDHEFVRMWWRDMERALPAQAQPTEPVEVDSQTPCHAGDFTTVEYQMEHARHKRAAEEAKKQDEEALAASMAANAAASCPPATNHGVVPPPREETRPEQGPSGSNDTARQAISPGAEQGAPRAFWVEVRQTLTNGTTRCFAPLPMRPGEPLRIHLRSRCGRPTLHPWKWRRRTPHRHRRRVRRMARTRWKGHRCTRSSQLKHRKQ